MKTQLRLGSVVNHGVGGSESQALDLIYAFLLLEFNQNLYRHISINQIGKDLDEFVIKEPGNKIHVNIRYAVYEDFEMKTKDEKNKIRLEVIHSALLRIAEYDKKIEIVQIEKIKKKILDYNFSFDIICKTYIHKKNKELIAKIIVHPEQDNFDYSVIIEQNKKVKCKLHLYHSRGDNFIEFFSVGKWIEEKKFIIYGKIKETEIHILLDECKVEILNLTSYSNPPYFTLMRSDVSEEDRKKSYKDWMHSLPPAVAGIIRENKN